MTGDDTEPQGQQHRQHHHSTPSQSIILASTTHTTGNTTTRIAPVSPTPTPIATGTTTTTCAATTTTILETFFHYHLLHAIVTILTSKSCDPRSTCGTWVRLPRKAVLAAELGTATKAAMASGFLRAVGRGFAVFISKLYAFEPPGGSATLR